MSDAISLADGLMLCLGTICLPRQQIARLALARGVNCLDIERTHRQRTREAPDCWRGVIDGSLSVASNFGGIISRPFVLLHLASCTLNFTL